VGKIERFLDDSRDSADSVEIDFDKTGKGRDIWRGFIANGIEIEIGTGTCIWTGMVIVIGTEIGTGIEIGAEERGTDNDGFEDPESGSAVEVLRLLPSLENEFVSPIGVDVDWVEGVNCVVMAFVN